MNKIADILRCKALALFGAVALGAVMMLPCEQANAAEKNAFDAQPVVAKAIKKARPNRREWNQRNHEERWENKQREIDARQERVRRQQEWQMEQRREREDEYLRYYDVMHRWRPYYPVYPVRPVYPDKPILGPGGIYIGAGLGAEE